MKILFLDIDGVINSTRSFLAGRSRLDAFNNSDNDEPYYSKITLCTIDPIAVDLINRLLDEFTDLYIVLSSSHRIHFRHMEHEHVQEYLRRLGLRGDRCIDCTPTLHNGPRGAEIRAWLIEHVVEKYAIVDDSNDMLEEQLPFFIRTDPEVGLSATDFRTITKLLGKEDTTRVLL